MRSTAAFRYIDISVSEMGRFMIWSIVTKPTHCTLLAFVFAVSGCTAQDLMPRARRVQSEVIGVDSHIDTLQRVLMEKADIGKRLPDGEVDLPRLREGGMHAPFFALWVP